MSFEMTHNSSQNEINSNDEIPPKERRKAYSSLLKRYVSA
jgi:hypothetical protein